MQSFIKSKLEKNAVLKDRTTCQRIKLCRNYVTKEESGVKKVFQTFKCTFRFKTSGYASEAF